MSSPKLFRFCGIALLLAAASLLGGVGLTLLMPDLMITPSTPLSSMQSPFWLINGGLNFAFGVLLLVGLPGLYLRLAGRRGDVLALVGTLLFGLSLCLEIASSAFFVAIIPVLKAKAPNVIVDTMASPLIVYGLGGALCSLLGLLVLGIALIRTRVYPVWLGVLFIILGLCIPLQIIFSGGSASTVMAAIAHTLGAFAFGSVGVQLITQGGLRSEVEARSHAVASV